MRIPDRFESVLHRAVDPFVVEWALRRLKALRKQRSPDTDHIEQNWFNDLTIRRILDMDDPDILTGIFHDLKPTAFSACTSLIADRWPTWEGTVACWSAPIIAKHDPNRTHYLFEAFVQSPAALVDINKVFGIVMALPLLPHELGQKSASRLVERILSSDPEQIPNMFFADVIGVAWKFELPCLFDLVTQSLEGSSEDNEYKKQLTSIYLKLTDNSQFWDHVSDLRQEHTSQSFASLAILFHENAPLDAIDKLVAQTGKSAWSAALDLLRQTPPDYKPSAFLREVFSSFRLPLDEKKIDELTGFVLGVVAAGYYHGRPVFARKTIDDLLDYVSLDIRKLPHLEEVGALAGESSKQEVIHGIKKRLRDIDITYGGVHLVEVVGILGWAEFVPMLIDCLKSEKSDLLCEAASRSLATMGVVAENEIIKRWHQLDSSQQIFCLGVLETIAGEDTADFVVNNASDLIKSNLEFWCYAVEAVADTRVFGILESQLHRKQPIIDKTFYTVCAIHDRDHPALSDAKSRILDSRRSSQRKRAVGATLEDLFDEKLHMELRCSKCGAENQYDVKEVFINPEHSGGSPFIADEIRCVSCDKEAEFSPTTMGHMALMAELLKITAAAQNKKKVESPLRFVTTTMGDGKQASPKEVIEYYERALKHNPKSVVDLLSLGNCYRTFNRPRRAKDYFSRCWEVDKTCVEAGTALAQNLAENGERQAAFDILCECLSHRDRWRFYRLKGSSPSTFGQMFAALFNELRMELRCRDVPALHPSFLGIRRKVGRNEPCPCGSGRKYKKCCQGKAQ